ncbi:hypothetical protein AB6735_21955 [Mucilaginibacter sp. RCC_168]|uniref:hypothetical protein n=1 Tax=Mucilaginibacter sp. RCC_168 TaxID=3239221 RepID=UPI003525A5F8
MEEIKLEILTLPIDEIALSDDCKLYLKQQGFSNLQEVIAKKWNGLREMDGFDYRKFNELIKFLQSQNLLSLMEN